jgi:hypothetical protein
MRGVLAGGALDAGSARSPGHNPPGAERLSLIPRQLPPSRLLPATHHGRKSALPPSDQAA